MAVSRHLFTDDVTPHCEPQSVQHSHELQNVIWPKQNAAMCTAKIESGLGYISSQVQVQQSQVQV